MLQKGNKFTFGGRKYFTVHAWKKGHEKQLSFNSFKASWITTIF